MSQGLQAARAVIRDGVRRWFSDICAERRTDRFYAFAFGCHEDFRSASMWANSLEILEANGVDPDEDGDRVWNPGEWTSFDPAYNTFFDEAWEAIAEDESDVSYENESMLRYHATCLGATLAALKDLNDEGLWTRGPVPVLAYFDIWDSADARWVTPESIRRVNSPQAFYDHPLHPIDWVGDVFAPEKPSVREHRRTRPLPLKTTFHEMFKDDHSF
jgi:hypothetical protein